MIPWHKYPSGDTAVKQSTNEALIPIIRTWDFRWFRIFWERISEQDRQSILAKGCLKIDNHLGRFELYPTMPANVIYRPKISGLWRRVCHFIGHPDKRLRLCLIPHQVNGMMLEYDYEIALSQLEWLRVRPEEFLETSVKFKPLMYLGGVGAMYLKAISRKRNRLMARVLDAYEEPI
jgi:hypothetical protein